MAKLPNNVLEFSNNEADRAKGYENFIEYYEAYKNGRKANEAGVSFAQMDATMLTFFKDEIAKVSGKAVPSTSNELAQYVMFQDVALAAFSVVSMLSDLIIPDALFKSYGLIADFKNGAWGDTLKIDIQPRDLFIVSKGSRNKRTFDITRQYKGTKTIVPEPREVTVGISLYEILIGKYTLAEFTAKVVESIEVNMRYEIYDALAAVMANLPTTAGAGALRITGYTQDGAIALAQKIQAWNKGAKAVFVGTKLALSKILPASTNARVMFDSDYVKVGYLRDFFGFTTLELDQIADYTTEFAVKLDDTKIWILCPGVDKLIKVFIEGSTLADVSGNYAHANLVNTATMIKSYGIGAYSSAIAGCIDLE